jgi:hypothetical protein
MKRYSRTNVILCLSVAGTLWGCGGPSGAKVGIGTSALIDGCPNGVGFYCGVPQYGPPINPNSPNILWGCASGGFTYVQEWCDYGCQVVPGDDDRCAPPPDCPPLCP